MISCPASRAGVFTIKEATMLKKVVLAVGLIAIPSIAPAQQEQCQLECTRVTEKGETSVTRSCYALKCCSIIRSAATYRCSRFASCAQAGRSVGARRGYRE